MNKTTSANPLLVLTGLDGSNPLAVLAAIGTLRSLSCIHPDNAIRMKWTIENGAWRPVLSSSTTPLDEATVYQTLAEWLVTPPQMSLLESKELGDNLTVSPQTFRGLAKSHLDKAQAGDVESRIALDFLAAFGTDAAHQPHSKDRSLMQDTAWRTMSGAGHQHFIKFIREIIANTTAEHLASSLFRPWTYQDEGRGMNLRWDPIDDRRYAMRWKNPSSDPATTMRGANRLAIEALPMFPTAPIGNRLETVGFVSRRGTFFTWPIWNVDLPLPVVRSLLQMDLRATDTSTDAAHEPKQLGIAAVFRSQRITVGKFRNFTPARSLPVQ